MAGLIRRYRYRGRHREHGNTGADRVRDEAQRGQVKQPATQNTRPWQAVARSTVAAAVGLLPIVPVVVDVLDLEALPLAVTAMACTAAITRILATPEVETWLRANLPWFAAGAYDDSIQSIEGRQKHEQASPRGSASTGGAAEESDNFGPDSPVQ